MRYVVHIFVLLCCFPYLDILRIGTDTQPNALVMATLLLLTIKKKKVNATIVMLWIIFLLSLFLIFFNNGSLFLYTKTILNYLSPAILSMVTYALLTKLNYKFPFGMFMMTILIYAFVGLMQTYVIPDFLTILVNGGARGNLINGRGVVSLTSEPAFYGIMCLFFMVYSLLVYTRRQNWIAIPVLLIQLVGIAKSSTGLAIFLAGLGCFTVVQILRLKMTYVVAVGMALLVTIPMIRLAWSQVEGTRMGEMAEIFIENPLLLTQVDASVAVRFTASAAPFLAIRHHNFMPQGLGYYSEFLGDFYRRRMYKTFIRLSNVINKPRLAGAINLVLYQMGFVGLLFPFALFLAFKPLLKSDHHLFAFILFIVILLTVVPLMHSTIGFIIGTALYKSHQHRTRTEIA